MTNFPVWYHDIEHTLDAPWFPETVHNGDYTVDGTRFFLALVEYLYVPFFIFSRFVWSMNDC